MRHVISQGSTAPLLTFCLRDVCAKGRVTPTGFVVIAGSYASRNHRKSAARYHWVVEMRERLKAAGDLTAAVGSCNLLFARDVTFSSPSSAAAVVAGGAISGKTAWKDERGRTLKELETIAKTIISHGELA